MSRILLKLASRSRPDRLRAVVAEFLRLSSGRHDLRCLISADVDDPSMAGFSFPDRRVTVRYGISTSKIHAINRDITGDFDVLVVAADDMWPAVPGWDDVIAGDLAQSFPNLDGAMHYNDGVRDDLCTMPVVGANLYAKLGYVYHPSYVSLWADNEFTDVLRRLRRLPYSPRVVVRHEHHTAGGRFDELYARNDAHFDADRANYERRAAAGFEVPEVLFSMLICSLAQRAGMLRALLDDLNRQAALHGLSVEVCVHLDGGARPTGAKRNDLIERAVGRFVAFIDDDDGVAPDYVARIVAAIREDPGCDCLSLEGVYTYAGQDPRRFCHSLAYNGWYEQDGVYYRTPNHLNAVRREHAAATGFPQVYYGEDRDYSERLKRRLRREARVEGGPLYHYRFDPAISASSRR